MKEKSEMFTPQAMAFAVRAAIVAMSLVPVAQAADSEEDPAVTAMVRPTSTIEAGVGYNSDKSYKFGEYNGLQDRGVTGIANFDIRGGGRYDNGDTTRWSVQGSNLGLEDRNLQAEYGMQGLFRLKFEYDELLRNRSDSYQTPYLGAGSNNLTLQPDWQVPSVQTNRATINSPNARGLSAAVQAGQYLPTTSGASVTGGPAVVAGIPASPGPLRAAQAALIIGNDLPDFHGYDLDTKRTRYEGGFLVNFGSEWDFQASARHEDKDGAKPMGTVSRATGGDISMIIADPIKQTTDQFNASANWTGKRGFAQAAYYGSVFYNDVKSLTWQNWAMATNAAGNTNTMSSAPDNQFHQINFTGGWSFTPTTKLVASGSYGRGTQNERFLQDAFTPYVSRSSLEGLVETSSVNVKFSFRPLRNLNSNLGYKYDNRDNQTPVGIFAFYDTNETPAAAPAVPGTNNQAAFQAFSQALGLSKTAIASNGTINANRPYSRKLNQVTFDNDYRVWHSQYVKLGYEFEQIDRECPGSWIDCSDAKQTREHSGMFEWHGNLFLDSLNGRAGYTYASKKVDYNENAFLALVPMANVVPNIAPASATMSAYQFMKSMGWTGYGPVAGYVNTATLVPANVNYNLFFNNNNALTQQLYGNANRISELVGMRRYNLADRDRHKVRGNLNWQATDSLSFQGGLDFNKDEYDNSVYGLKDAEKWAFNFDADYVFSEKFKANVFYTHEIDRQNSAGNTYTANSATAAQNGVTALSSTCGSYANLLARNLVNKIDPCTNWGQETTDDIDTVGLDVNHKGFFGGRLELNGNFIYSMARTNTDMTGGNWANNPAAGLASAPTRTIAAFWIPAADLPEVKTETYQIALTGQYKLDVRSSLRGMYSYAHMSSNDYMYDGMQAGGLSGVLPSFEKAPSYSDHFVGLSYIYSFNL